MKNLKTKYAIIILFICTLSSTVFGQDTVDPYLQNKKEVNFGIRTGGNKSYFISEGTGRMKNNFLIGIYGSYTFNKKLDIRIDAYYTQLGTIANTSLAGEYTIIIPSQIPWQDDLVLNYNYALNGETTFSNDYLCIPILINYNIGNTGLSAILGPRIGFLLKNETNWEGSFSLKDDAGDEIAPNLIADNVLNEVYEQIEFNSLDFSISYGISYRYKDFPIWLDFRGNYGLNKINKNETSEFSTDMKNTSFELALNFEIF